MQREKARFTLEEVRNTLVDLIHEIVKIPREEIHDEATIENELAMDSESFIELQVAVEEALGIEIDVIDIIELNAFKPIVEHIFGKTVKEVPS